MKICTWHETEFILMSDLKFGVLKGLLCLITHLLPAVAVDFSEFAVFAFHQDGQIRTGLWELSGDTLTPELRIFKGMQQMFCPAIQ